MGIRFWSGGGRPRESLRSVVTVQLPDRSKEQIQIRAHRVEEADHQSWQGPSDSWISSC